MIGNNKRTKWTGSDLDRKVSISTVSSTSINLDTGSETPVYAAAVEVPAMILELPASKETEISGGIQYDSVMTVVIRYKAAYEDTKIKVTYKGKDYDVINSREGYERRRWLILKCVYGGKQLNR